MARTRQVLRGAGPQAASSLFSGPPGCEAAKEEGAGKVGRGAWRQGAGQPGQQEQATVAAPWEVRVVLSGQVRGTGKSEARLGGSLGGVGGPREHRPLWPSVPIPSLLHHLPSYHSLTKLPGLSAPALLCLLSPTITPASRHQVGPGNLGRTRWSSFL